MPHLIARGSVKRCSVCGRSFDTERELPIDDAFLEHLHKAHQFGLMGEENQAVARIVRGNTQD